MTDTSRLISALQENSAKLLGESWFEAWGFRTGKDQPLRLNVSHTIIPGADGSYRLRSAVSFGVRVSRHLDAELARASDTKQLSRFPDQSAAAA